MPICDHCGKSVRAPDYLGGGFSCRECYEERYRDDEVDDV